MEVLPAVGSLRIVLLVLGGEYGDDSETLDIASHAEMIVCADGGAEYPRRLKLTVDAIVGDLDSISEDTLSYFRTRGTSIVQEADQETNDFEKALRYLSRTTIASGLLVRVLGMTGGRTDHTLSNLSVMLRHRHRFGEIIACDRFGEHQLISTDRPDCILNCLSGSTISLTPFGEAHGVWTENLRYPLLGETLALGMREGLSNVTSGQPARVSIERGALLVSIIRSTEH